MHRDRTYTVRITLNGAQLEALEDFVLGQGISLTIDPPALDAAGLRGHGVVPESPRLVYPAEPPPREPPPPEPEAGPPEDDEDGEDGENVNHRAFVQRDNDQRYKILAFLRAVGGWHESAEVTAAINGRYTAVNSMLHTLTRNGLVLRNRQRGRESRFALIVRPDDGGAAAGSAERKSADA